MTPRDFLDWRARQKALSGLAGFAGGSLTLQAAGRAPEQLRALRVTSEFFDVLRVRPVLGRGFSSENEIEGQHRVAVISYGLWQSHFGGASEIIGQRISVNGGSYEVTGVAPPAFSFPPASAPTQLWIPLVIPPDERVRQRGRHSAYIMSIGRLQPGVSLDHALEDLNRIAVERPFGLNGIRRCAGTTCVTKARAACCRSPDHPTDARSRQHSADAAIPQRDGRGNVAWIGGELENRGRPLRLASGS